MRRSLIAVLLIVLVASFISLVSVPASAAPPAPTTSDPDPVLGENVTYVGTIGTAGPRTVTVQKLYRSVWYSYSSTQTAADGEYTIEVSSTATEPRTFRIFAPAEDDREAVGSDTFEVRTVQPDAPTTTDPDPVPGESVTYTGNIGMETKRTVTVQKEYNGRWYSRNSVQSDADGDYSIEVTNDALAPRTFRILVPAVGDLPALTTKGFEVTIDIPAAPKRVGSKPFAGQTATYTGNIGTTGVRPVVLQKLYNGKWFQLPGADTDASGAYTVELVVAPADRTYRVVAPAFGGNGSVTTEEFEVEPKKDELSLSIFRADGKTVATGRTDPFIEGREFTLQYKNGSSYRQVGAKFTAENDDGVGIITITSPITVGRTYRLVGKPPATGASSAVSNSVTFRNGPSKLGQKVIYVTTDSGKSPVTKGVDYTGTATLVDGDGVTEPLDLETIAVRGNSSAGKVKKPYKLKFEDKYTPFGMAEDKTWILLANYGDWSLIRSMVAWDLGQQLDGLQWTPDSEFTELYVNGYYKGSYQLVESIKIAEARTPVNDETGQIIEFDPHYKEDGVPGFRGSSGMDYAWKDPDEFKFDDEGDPEPDGLTVEKINAMKTKIRNFETVLYGVDGKKDWSKAGTASIPAEDDWMTYLDLDSAIDYYLAREFTKDNDADFYRSNFFYTNDVDPTSPDKFFMGPIWDFDRSAGAKNPSDTSVDRPTGWWVRGNGSPTHNTNKIHWFTRITKDPRFLKELYDRWDEKKDVFKDVSSPTGGNTNSAVYRAVFKLGGTDLQGGYQVGANDRSVWQNYGSRYRPRTSSFPGEIAWVRKWYEDRYNWMNSELIKQPPPIPD